MRVAIIRELTIHVNNLTLNETKESKSNNAHLEKSVTMPLKELLLVI